MFYILCLITLSHAMPTTITTVDGGINPAAFVEFPLDPDNEEAFSSMYSSFINMESDGVTPVPGKKMEKLPLTKDVARDEVKQEAKQPKSPFATEEDSDYDFLKGQPGVAPKFTGSVQEPKESSSSDSDYFNFGEGAMADTNPASKFLEGGDFEKIATPTCKLVGCTGPVPNDGSFSTEAITQPGKSCTPTFIPMNGCTDNKGYPMAMLCTICCDCAQDFVAEMKKTHGYKVNYQS